MRKRQRGQSTAEYAVVLGVVLAALVAMQIYVKRGVNARVKIGVDEFTNAGTTNLPWLPGADLTGDVTLSRTRGQYEPYYAESSFNVLRKASTIEEVDLQGKQVKRDILDTEKEETKRKADGYQLQRKWQDQAD